MLSASNPPLVSVIIPVHDGQRFFQQALHSALHQTYANIEVIIVDAREKTASEDIEACVAEGLKPTNVFRDISILRMPSESLPAAINHGLSLAKGAFLTVLPTEDAFHLERIEKLVKMLSDAKSEIGFSYVVAIDAKGAALPFDHTWRKNYERIKFEVRGLAPTVGFQLLKDPVADCVGNLFFSRHLFKEVGVFNKDLPLVFDREFILRALVFAEPLLLCEELYFHRLDEKALDAKNFELQLNNAYRTYLVNISAQPPKNLIAPCPLYWPAEFSQIRAELNMDHGLSSYVDQPASMGKKQNMQPTSSPPSAVRNGAKPICLISHELSLTGAPKLVADLAVCLKENGYNPSVVSLCDGPMGDELKKHQIPVHFLYPRSQGKVPYHKRILGILWLVALKSKRVTLVNCAVSWPYVLTLALLNPFRSVIWYIHDSYFPANLSKWPLASRLFNWLNKKKKISNVWYGSNSTRDTWAGFSVGGESMYWSGIPAAVTQKASKMLLKNLLSVGTASTRKGTYYLIEAFLSCLEEGKIPEDTTLTVVGFDIRSNQSVHLGDLILRIVNSGHKDRIKLVGSVEPDQLDAYYEHADLYIQSSLAECLPISILKAMSCGLPIITTDVDGCPEAIQHGHTGYVCPARNSKALAEAIVEALHNPEKSLKYGWKAQEKFNAEFSLEATQKKILDRIENFFPSRVG